MHDSLNQINKYYYGLKHINAIYAIHCNVVL